jgi:hypothetical protein
MILALQYYEGDRVPAMRLARLLADLEPRPRTDVVLGLVCQPGTPCSDDVRDTIAYCGEKFPVVPVTSEFGALGWGDGSGQLWRGTMTHFSRERRGHSSIFTFDGADGVPLHNNWLDLMIAEHARTRSRGKRVSGFLNLDLPAYPHVNANMVLDFSVWDDNPSLRDTPLGASADAQAASLDSLRHNWDIYHARVFLSCARASTVVSNQWNQRGFTKKIMSDLARRSVWLHGYKDDYLHEVAGEVLLRDLRGRPTSPELQYQDDLLELVLARLP